MRAEVIGGGVGGLAAALALARTGWNVVVREQAATLTDVGAGVQLSPNAVKALRWLGVDAALASHVVAPAAIELRRARGDRLLVRSALGESVERRYGGPYWHVLRADLQRTLADAALAAGAALRLGERVQDVEAIGADLIVAADGVRSVLRGGSTADPPARFTGQVAWRGLVPLSDVPAGTPSAAVVRIGPGRHFVSYRVDGGRAVNFVAVVEQVAWRAEGWSEPGDPAQLAQAFADWPAPVRALIAACTECRRWALLDREPRPRRIRPRTVTLGDAAQPILPFLAQGAAMALEDAVVLARRLQGEGADGVDAALAAYDAERRPRAARVLRSSRRNAFAFHAREPLASLGQTALRIGERLVPGALDRSLGWLYGYDCRVA